MGGGGQINFENLFSKVPAKLFSREFSWSRKYSLVPRN